MKKIICLVLALMACISFTACGEGNNNEGRSGVKSNGKSVSETISERINSGKETEAPDVSTGFVHDDLSTYDKKVDIDLTKMGASMTYSQVSNFISSPKDYVGKTVKMKGYFTYGEGDDRYYFACIIPDATACCSQGIEFVLRNDRSFPADYPEVGDEITIIGVFDTYMEGKYRYCQLTDAFRG